MAVFFYTLMAVFLLSAGTLTYRFQFALQVERRVKKMVASGHGIQPYGTLLQMTRAIMFRISENAVKISSQNFIKRTESQIRAMGFRGNAEMRKWVAIKLIWAVVTGIVAFFVVMILHNMMSIMMGLGIILFSLLVFRMLIKQKVQHFTLQIRRQLPGFLDMLTISVEAGLGFDQALERNSRPMQNELGREIRLVLAEMNLGKSRRDALRDAGNRVGVEEFTGFASAVIQADRLGMGLANVLRIQASETRRRMSEKVKERAMKAPIKILFPLIIFLFPALFIIILGPAVIRIAALFIK